MAMVFFLFKLFSIALSIVVSCANADTSFDTNYQPQWGGNHLINNQGREVQLLLDQSSGAGFQSKSSFCYGSFRMRMKISNKPSGGVISSFFLIAPPTNNPSPPNSRGNHDEFDFEFLGTGNAASLQTNVFANDDGHREQKVQLWFDPSQDFHTYELVWNPNQIVFNVDGRPVRVFNKGPGINFASKAMHVEASIWNVSWAGVVDWSKAPFTAYYQGFDIVANQTSSNSFCKASISDRTVEKNWELSPKQQRQYEEIRKKYLIWDYCSDKSRYHPECENW